MKVQKICLNCGTVFQVSEFKAKRRERKLNFKMSDEAVSLATLKQTIQKCPEIHPLPLEMQNFVRGNDVGDYKRFYDEVKEWKKDVVVCIEKLQKQLQKVAKGKFCQDCHEHGRIQACHFCLYEILGEDKR